MLPLGTLTNGRITNSWPVSNVGGSRESPFCISLQKEKLNHPIYGPSGTEKSIQKAIKRISYLKLPHESLDNSWLLGPFESFVEEHIANGCVDYHVPYSFQ